MRARAVGLPAALVVLVCVVVCPEHASAQEQLTCGVPLMRTLPAGGVHTYHVSTPVGAEVQIQSSAVSPALGLRRMRLMDAGGALIDDRTTGILEFTGRAGVLTLEVSQNSGNTGGTYTVALSIVSEGSGNCGQLLECGATPAGTGFVVPGAVNTYQIPLQAGEEDVELKLNYLEPPAPGDAGAPYLRVFDPHGNEIAPGRCTGTIEIEPTITGTYTAAVSACGAPVQRDYRIELYRESVCPIGPTITYFGISNAQNDPLKPESFDPAGRPIYTSQLGYGLHLVLEARTGASNRRAGDYTVEHEEQGILEDADLQVILSRALGDGDPTPCDILLPEIGGVPATTDPFDFDDRPETSNAIQDLGCRFDNGQGLHIGRRSPLDACTKTNQGFGESFVDRESLIQYCTGPIDTAWAFADGDTTVKARLKDLFGNFGASREIVIRVGRAATFTPTRTRTPLPPTPTATSTHTVPSTVPSTHTATRTRTPSPTPGTPTETTTPDGRSPTSTATHGTSHCASDCNGDGTVAVNELIVTVNIALNVAPVARCPAGDVNGDGMVKVVELVQAVNGALNGCVK